MSTALNAPADGYTIAYSDSGHWAINSALNPKLSYDPEKDFVPIGLFGETTGLFIAVTDRIPAKTLPELIALAKEKPGALTYGSAGVGSIHHLIMEDFKANTKLDILHIPYKGSTQTLPALLSGEVSMAIASLGSVSNYVEQGKVRLLAVSTKKRSPLALDVPTIAELAVPDFDHAGAEGLVARTGTPQEVIDKLSAALAKTVVLPEVHARFIAFGLVPLTDTSPKSMGEIMRADREKYARVVKLSGITAE
jgi:tripartite-type tricarboxylate transporter receptor subunit TctC